MMKYWIPDVAKRIAQHLENKSADTLTSSIHRFRASEIYQNPTRDIVATAAPYPLFPSALLLGNGKICAANAGVNGPSVLLTRHEGGQVKAYRNACRHRGSPLVRNGCYTKGPALACPYHAWMYDARTGALKGVPGERIGFPCLKKDQLSLPEVPVYEQAGFVWCSGSQDSMDRWSRLEEVDQELSAILPSHENSPIQIATKEWNVAANWQLVVETFLEAYHVSSLHKRTLAVVAHSVMVTDRLDDGRSYRMTVPLKHFDLARQTSDRSFFDQTTTTYFLFPSTAVSLFKRFVLFLSVQPEGAGNASGRRTKIRAWGVKRTAAEEEDATKDFDNVIAGIEEDWDCAEGIFQNMDAESVFTYGLQEGGNILFLQNVEKAARNLT
jgi:phenylpropionate dioxygenase-like ring-hydroxylating dioxygenase large terminal subunit